jgi:carbon-monoxide dehydrogenase medium subunit
MKPAPFAYHAPRTLNEALSVLDEVGEHGKVLAGGQSLIPMLNMRLAAPGHLVDINKLAELDTVTATSEGVRVGAAARHATVLRDDAAFSAVPLLRQALELVAHPVIRNRGTTVGSLAHADPSGEMTAVLALLGGHMELARRDATRIVRATDFFVGPLESCIQPGELATHAFFPALPPRSGTAFIEVARRHGDYAVCGVAAAVTLDTSSAIASARCSYISVSPTPLVLDLTQAMHDFDDTGAGRLAQEMVEPEADIHASADYRRHLVGVLTARALQTAAARATDAMKESA